MTPEPSPDESADEASTETTDGSTVAATCSTEPAGAGAAFPDPVGEVSSEDAGCAVAVDDESECTR